MMAYWKFYSKGAFFMQIIEDVSWWSYISKFESSMLCEILQIWKRCWYQSQLSAWWNWGNLFWAIKREVGWHTPNSLKDSNVPPNWKQWKGKESRHAPWFATLWKGKGACWSSGMGLGRINKLQLLKWTCIKSTQGGQCIVEAFLVLGRAMGNSYSQDSPRPRLGGNHHLPPYSILCTSPWGATSKWFFLF
jgi:hypothetical protein